MNCEKQEGEIKKRGKEEEEEEEVMIMVIMMINWQHRLHEGMNEKNEKDNVLGITTGNWRELAASYVYP